ncbi:hypothetical protein DFP93_10577 [Aneurinibacillus soli]|uniref:Uncharacterized protein n=1 Tax=Aneurinibacillus soli TaxID=1500254 RepID=A0A0U5B2Y6_9BACL|nr:hypothetical protein [Aneurinibacillus soli]PYE62124.1 hypothetical protein DFP93_10577 [Aneurinibacillus soli]BAU28688.1 hypothetical protein CB4_02863 [Aneurinibacillus soli]
MNRREMKRFAKKNPQFVTWAKKNRQKVQTMARSGNYTTIMKEWERSRRTTWSDRKAKAKQIAQSMQDVQNFMNNVESVFGHLRTLHERATKHLKR